jgi:hypothetical protein
MHRTQIDQRKQDIVFQRAFSSIPADGMDDADVTCGIGDTDHRHTNERSVTK